ncbi:PadR family transcriptional regulator [Paenibacillus sediminis]|uniref:DNA-binding PadR family transcriptional regulator n=1 Tax=Paenibacillus sediminis TaxID=664909 RepID=A0ABS4H389_9BACL|nr:PadR family transcriptional regulator [Paenibacillus sediminis]MBP1937007.1 DNA-binding PadR family transcriptional regulator [Paenibacillus sediminis]
MTRLMVLGLLTYRPMSGYEMQQMLQQSQTDKWAGILPGSIYHSLKTMTADGLVEIDAVEHTGHRAKAIYKITDKGREQFFELLKSSLVEPSVAYPTTLYTAISFLELLPKEVILESINVQEKALREQYEEMKRGEEQKAAHTSLPAHIRLVFQNMYDQFEIQLRFLQKLRELYE